MLGVISASGSSADASMSSDINVMDLRVAENAAIEPLALDDRHQPTSGSASGAHR